MRTEAEVRKLYARRRERMAAIEQHCLQHHARAHFAECEYCGSAIEAIRREVDLIEWVLEIEPPWEDVPTEPMSMPERKEDSHAEE